jgi:hypothetical protein
MTDRNDVASKSTHIGPSHTCSGRCVGTDGSDRAPPKVLNMSTLQHAGQIVLFPFTALTAHRDEQMSTVCFGKQPTCFS